MNLTKWAENEKSNKVIFLIDGDDGNVLSLSKKDNGDIDFYEECEHYFSVTMTKQNAIIALQEAIDWINADE